MPHTTDYFVADRKIPPQEGGLVSGGMARLRFREVRFRSAPLVALSIVLVLTGAIGAWHMPDDRDDEGPVIVHNHADHDARVSAHAPTPAPEHCALCHWLRAFGNGAPVETQALAAESFQFVRIGAHVEHVHATSRLILPSRAPPPA